MKIGIVSEEACSLPKDLIGKHDLELVKVPFEWKEVEGYPGDNIYQKMRQAIQAGIKTFVKTSQPSPKSYLNAFKNQLAKSDLVLCPTISSKLSGSYNSAIQAREMIEEKERIFVIDSKSGACGQGLFIFRAIELLEKGLKIQEVLKQLEGFSIQNHLYLFFEDPKYIEASGRMSQSQADWVRRMKKLHFHPMIELKPDGNLGKGGIIFAKDEVEALFKKVKKESKGQLIRVAINHADRLEDAEKLKDKLEGELKATVLFIDLATPIIASHAGPGSLLLSWSPKE